MSDPIGPVNTFYWRVNADASGGGEFHTRSADFGDGYSQEVADGLNTDRQKWSVTYCGYKADVAVVLAFIRSKVGTAFYWTPPLGVQGWYKCRSYKPTNQGGLFYTLSMEFEQAFFP